MVMLGLLLCSGGICAAVFLVPQCSSIWSTVEACSSIASLYTASLVAQEAVVYTTGQSTHACLWLGSRAILPVEA